MKGTKGGTGKLILAVTDILGKTLHMFEPHSFTDGDLMEISNRNSG